MSRADPISILDLPAAERNDRLGEDVQESMTELKQLLGTSSSDQEEILEFRQRYDRLAATVPLAPRSIKNMHDGRSRYLSLQKRLIELAARYEPLLYLDEDRTEKLDLDPVVRERAVLISFLAALTTYDNYLSMRTVVQDDRLRRLIDNPARGYGKTEEEILAILDDLNSDRRQRRLKNMVKGYDHIRGRLEAENDPDIDFLQMAIESNAAYRFAKHATLSQKLPGTTRRWRERIMDGLASLGNGTLGTLSELFGNGIGLVEIRKGKLYGNREIEKHLSDELQPLDLLLEKTPFRLTDKFIPGHFGHVAVWVGTAKELDDIGLFDDPLFETDACKACPTQVRAGHSVLEALRTGVQMSTLAEFMNVDDLLVLRPKGMNAEEKKKALLRAFRQVGKQYDFNFEVQTIDKITCSELAYHVFPDIPWETDTQLGQFTISPDQVASQAMEADSPLELIDFYHDGNRVEPAEALARMTRLVRDEEA